MIKNAKSLNASRKKSKRPKKKKNSNHMFLNLDKYYKKKKSQKNDTRVILDCAHLILEFIILDKMARSKWKI